MIKTKDTSYREVISTLRYFEAGCIIESFVKVEFGEEFLKTAWTAFQDIGDYFEEEFENIEALVNQFILMLDDEVEFKSAGLPVCL